MARIPTRAVNLTRQLVAITGVIPSTQGRVRNGELDCTIPLQPSPASRTYTVRLVYRHGRRPRVTVTDPPLARHPGAQTLPHVYPPVAMIRSDHKRSPRRSETHSLNRGGIATLHHHTRRNTSCRDPRHPRQDAARRAPQAPSVGARVMASHTASSRVVLPSWGSAPRSNHGQTIKRPATRPGRSASDLLLRGSGGRI
jgi:hypothetical protein